MSIPNILNNKELDTIFYADLWFEYFVNRNHNLLFIWNDDLCRFNVRDINHYLCFKYSSDILENRIEQIKKSIRQNWIQSDYNEYECAYFTVNFNVRNTAFIKIKINQDDFKTHVERHLT